MRRCGCTGTSLFMQAPGEATGSIALESTIDEMALACGMDPLAFRLKNYAEVEPITGKPFSSKALRACYEQGAARFGWAKRPLSPRQMRDGDGLLIGWGLGTATFPAMMFQAEARAVIRRDGTGVMEIGAHDMGQGAWTELARIAADGLGLDVDRVRIQVGHVGSAGRRHRRRVGAHRDRGKCDPQRRNSRDRQARRSRNQ